VNGGIPGGSIIQLLGESGHGKSSLSMDLLARAQESGLRTVSISGREINAIVLDVERSFDPNYAKTFGVDVDKVMVVRTKWIEDSFNLAEAALLAGVQFFLIDSIGQVVSKDEADKDYNDPEKLGAEARAIQRHIKHMQAYMDGKTLIVVINQYRANINKMGHAPDRKAYGARVIGYASKITWELRRIEQNGERDVIDIFVAKNKVGGKKGIKVQFELVSTEGIDYQAHIIELALRYDIIEQRGARYYYPSYEDQQYSAHGKQQMKDKFPWLEITQAVVGYLMQSEEESTDE